MTLQTRETAWQAVHDTRTSGAELAAIAAAHPEFAYAIAQHPHAYPELVEWATSVAGAASDTSGPRSVTPRSATADSGPIQLAVGTGETPNGGLSPRRTLGRRLWVVFAALLVGFPVLLSLIAVLPGEDVGRYWMVERNPLLSPASLAFLAICAVGISAAALSAPTVGRRVAAVTMLGFVALGGFFDVNFSYDAWWPMWGYDQLGIVNSLSGVILMSLAYSAWGLSRPLRGAGWAALPIVVVLPFLLELLAWWHVRNWFGASWELYEVRVFVTLVIGTLVIPAVGVLLARRWNAASEIAAEQRASRVSAVVPGVAAQASERTNVLAILALVFAFLVSVLAVVFGHIALSQIRRTGEQGRGLAIAGLVLGYVGLGLGLIAIILYGSAIVMALSYGGY